MTNRRYFYFCYDHNHPSGGQKHTYEHVDVLNEQGYEAAVVHSDAGFRLTWFENNTRVISQNELNSIFRPERDVMVLPEDLGARAAAFPGRKVIFNKNLYHGFRSFGRVVPPEYLYLRPDVVAALAVSDHNLRHLRFAYPELPVFRVYSSIQADLFRYTPWASKKARILTIGKESPQLLTIYHTLMSRAAAGFNNAARFEWIFAENKTEAEMAALMGSAVAIIFTNVEEGLPRFVLESIASGRIVDSSSAMRSRSCSGLNRFLMISLHVLPSTNR